MYRFSSLVMQEGRRIRGVKMVNGEAGTRRGVRGTHEENSIAKGDKEDKRTGEYRYRKKNMVVQRVKVSTEGERGTGEYKRGIEEYKCGRGMREYIRGREE